MSILMRIQGGKEENSLGEIVVLACDRDGVCVRPHGQEESRGDLCWDIINIISLFISFRLSGTMGRGLLLLS